MDAKIRDGAAPIILSHDKLMGTIAQNGNVHFPPRPQLRRKKKQKNIQTKSSSSSSVPPGNRTTRRRHYELGDVAIATVGGGKSRKRLISGPQNRYLFSPFALYRRGHAHQRSFVVHFVEGGEGWASNQKKFTNQDKNKECLTLRIRPTPLLS